MITIKGDALLGLIQNLPPNLRETLIKRVQREKFLQGKLEFMAIVGDNVDKVDKSVDKVGGTFENLGFGFGIITLPVDNLENLAQIEGVGYVELPQTLYTTEFSSNKASCIPDLWDLYKLTGKGVMVGVLDSGIDYLHPAFINKEGKTRIKYIYDLSQVGVIYTEQEINKAIESENPYSIVNQRDPNGHGTHVTSIACAGGNIRRELYGVAYESDIAMVKLTPEGMLNYTKSTVIMRGIKFLLDKKNENNQPLVINLSFSTNDGAHNGSSVMEQYINTVCNAENITFVVAAGNEADRGHHVGGMLRKEQNISLNIGKEETGIIFQLYKGILSDISIELKNPSGISTGKFRIKEGFREGNAGTDRVSFYYTGPKPFNISGEIIIAILPEVSNYINDGVWTIKIYLDNDYSSNFDIWLPIAEGLNTATKFLKPNVFNTLGIPATVQNVVSVGSYDYATGNISSFSGRGGEGNPVLKPDLVAPGESIQGAIPGGRFDTKTGTSMAAPQVAGICALFMQWGMIERNDPFLYGERLKYYLLRGAKRNRQLTVYPNVTWGYGTVCADNSLQLLIDESFSRNLNNEYRGFRMNCGDLYVDSNYTNYVVEYNGDILGALENIDFACGFILDDNFAIVTVQTGKERRLLKEVKEIVYLVPKMPYTLNSTPIEAAQIDKFNDNKYLNLRGKGVLIGIVDTGINYLSREFMYEDDTTRIFSIWDQTVSIGPSPEGLIFGTEYTSEKINEAIKANERNENPYSIVPSFDEIGHGTSMACIIAGRGYNPQVRGGAPDSELVVVKLKTANSRLDINIEDPVYEGTDLIVGIKYLFNIARALNRPMVIYIPLGTNLGPHDGNSVIERYIDDVSRVRGIVAVTSTGNEGESGTHAAGEIDETGDFHILELKVSPEQKNLMFEVWATKPDKISLGIVSPSGEVIEKIPAKLQEVEEIKFVYEGTRVTVEYFLPEELTGDELIRVTMRDLKEGIWQFRIIGDYIVNGTFNAYLLQRKLLRGDTRFLNSTPYGTLTPPSTSRYIISTSFYNQNNNSIVAVSGRGFTRDERIKPDITTGGIDARTISKNDSVITISGASVASATLASACALMLQWGIVDGNDPTLYAPKLKTYLIRGTNKRPGDVYPNREWGYGMLSLEGVFQSIRTRCSSCESINFLPDDLDELKSMVLDRNKEV
ncbi:S8 family serine peptidase [Clostridium frigidicarnis]|uniref:Subtilase family protein n=1 Tax=Clostridium frigidicarnis TaxID=84698 RepID=A0A1I0YTP6_9CLOT|nr:S8 family serine peptidase [Clostridium frigidicarnis]SFB15493.1 Subtilase family protein [Clostridium frigidicarnis]